MAMKIKYTLEQYNISSRVTRLPAKYTSDGCAYAVEISPRDESTALRIITLSNLSYGKVIRSDQ